MKLNQVLKILLILAIVVIAWGWNRITFVQEGSKTYVVNALGVRMNGGFHEYRILDNGQVIVKLGALTYLLGASWSAKSSGYHEIVPQEYGGYEATTGVRSVLLDVDGKPRNAHKDPCF